MSKMENYSVIMSVYYKVKPEDLAVSINSIINQTYKTNEFILIKDGKLTDDQENVIKKIKIFLKYINLKKIMEQELLIIRESICALINGQQLWIQMIMQ